MYAYFNCGFEINMTLAQARGCAQPGKDATEDVEELLRLPGIRRQFNKIDPKKIKTELREYGAWDDTELADAEENELRILWIAACNIVEDQRP